MKKNTVKPDIVTWTPPAKPSWQNARKYAETVRQGAEAIVKLGYELYALHEEHYNHGARTDLGTSSGAGRSVNGWQEKVKEELGISHQTALRCIERANVVVGLTKLIGGDSIDYCPKGSKEPRTIEPTPEIIAIAQEGLDGIITGTVSASRAFAGIAGEAGRRGKQSGLAHKAATDHAKNIQQALTKLKTSLPHWKKLSPEARASLEITWGDVLPLLPDTWEQE